MKLTLQQARDAYYARSKTLSDITRQFCLAGIAIVWLFRTTEGVDGVEWNPILELPLLYFFLSLCLDVVQYAYHSMAWGIFARYQEKCRKRKNEDKLEAPSWINAPAVICLSIKTGIAAIGYVVLAYFLWEQVF